jgi:glycosyltransferase involved in cell wall biosynthesis
MNRTRTGIGTYIHHLIDELKSGYDITLIKHESGMDIPGCDSISINNRIGKKYNSLLWNQNIRWHIRELKDLDLIHNPGQFLTPTMRDVRSVVTIHDITPILFPDYHFPFRVWSNRIFLPSVLKTSQTIITDSYHTKNDICSFYRIEPENIHVIHLAADPGFCPRPDDMVASWREKYGLMNPYLLYVGTIEPRKNIHTLIQAFSRIAHIFPDLHLILAGGIGWNSKPIFAEIKRSIFAGRIRYLNYLPHEELPLLYNGALALVYPSWYEGFGFPPLEAMQCGVPVVSSNSSSLPEVIGQGGILVDPHDIQGFADAICRLITDDTYRKEHIRYNLERSHLFSWKKTAHKTAMVYDKIMKKSL